MWSGWQPKFNGFFHGLCATFPPNFVIIGRAVGNPANKQTNLTLWTTTFCLIVCRCRLVSMEQLCLGLSHFYVVVHSPSVSLESHQTACLWRVECHRVASWGPSSFSSTALTSLPLPSGTAWVCTHTPTTTPNCISILPQRWSTTKCSDWWCAWKRSVNGWTLIDWG